MREKERKKLNEITSKTISLLIALMLGLHDSGFPALPAASTVRENPMKVAMVKSELTFTMPSRAVTWTLVLDLPVVAVAEVVVMTMGFCVSIEAFDWDSILFKQQKELDVENKI
ncbi:unnamed protein product [Fraxinus pennsylvanica]|uniref:Uncharacterized protein n=1 Tax=Fraxinus pennsylvanica TaxID=56036 RepID=A0AAD2E0X4_9LAMI|nr:unnamed protein product [Fraxinus pennsylvanica]